ncbi:hypothetical protein RFI_39929 [Reticulomyxa filosa]|uniref:Uncharacterized protein n=1 Tax=Reticulomyxa filosa TaxID=46433 RepID=X6L907_RETFI|nr:hypothetical protein RFI_39929 [Reticulomyxa filosa]|eukprot:ETN97601.1 hypothetical protein RFI_39929 [Reticulomyxa filosa]
MYLQSQQQYSDWHAILSFNSLQLKSLRPLHIFVIMLFVIPQMSTRQRCMKVFPRYNWYGLRVDLVEKIKNVVYYMSSKIGRKYLVSLIRMPFEKRLKQFELVCCLLFLLLQQLEYAKSTGGVGDEPQMKKKRICKNTEANLLINAKTYEKIGTGNNIGSSTISGVPFTFNQTQIGGYYYKDEM